MYTLIMLISSRWMLTVLSILSIAAGMALWFDTDSHWLAAVVVLLGLTSILVLSEFGSARRIGASSTSGKRESEDIESLTPLRCRELVRGTSLYLRERRYRYSIRIDPNHSSDQRCFTAEVNTVKLGFVPVLIIDNTNDRQGLGYVAFVHDGKRWRGPGLPCPAGQVEAVRHAAKCVSPLAKEEETRF